MTVYRSTRHACGCDRNEMCSRHEYEMEMGIDEIATAREEEQAFFDDLKAIEHEFDERPLIEQVEGK